MGSDEKKALIRRKQALIQFLSLIQLLIANWVFSRKENRSICSTVSRDILLVVLTIFGGLH